MSVTPTVRQRILDVIAARVAAISIGTTPAVTIAFVLRPGKRSEEAGNSIVAAVTSGKIAVELLVGHDEPVELATSQLQSLKMPVGVYMHLPDALPSGVDAGALASLAHAAVYSLYAGVADQPGRWNDGSVDLARATNVTGGGGVYLDPELFTNVTESAFEVEYAHLATDPGVAA